MKAQCRWVDGKGAFSVTLPPAVVARELELAALSVFQSRHNPHAESRGMGFLEDVLVFNEAKKELVADVAGCETIGEIALVVGGHAEVGYVACSSEAVVNWLFAEIHLRKLAICTSDGRASPSCIFHSDLDNDFH